MNLASETLIGSYMTDRHGDFEFILVNTEHPRAIRTRDLVGLPIKSGTPGMHGTAPFVHARGHFSGQTDRSVSQQQIENLAFNFIGRLDPSRSGEENFSQAERELTQDFILEQIATYEQIEERAFELHERNPSRSAEENWLEAEAALLGTGQS